MKELRNDAPAIKITRWPSPQDYNEAVQAPLASFADTELAEGRPELDGVGLPRPRSGNFATVYRLVCKNRDWAVRCFLNCTNQQEERYQFIETALTAMNSEHTVRFDYVRDGIHISGTSYPILKMEWAEGQNLDQFIHSNLGQAQKLKTLAAQLKSLNLLLKQHGIAHGDLQHGNILVSDSSIKLVDYDCMFVPGLAGRLSPELGHRNYQHPSRSISNYGPSLDNFSAWVIFVSLVVVAEDPNLWWNLAGGDDKLLFSQSDFINPTRSHAFNLLEHHSNETIRRHARFLRSLLHKSIDEIPFLDEEVCAPENLSELPERAEFSKDCLWYKSQDWLPEQAIDSATHASSLEASAGTEAIAPEQSQRSKKKSSAGFFLPALIFYAVWMIFNVTKPLPSRPTPVHTQGRTEARLKQEQPDDNLSKAQSLEERASKAATDGAFRFAVDLEKQAIDAYKREGSRISKPVAHLSNLEHQAKCWHDLSIDYERSYEYRSALQAIDNSIDLYSRTNNTMLLKDAYWHRKFLVRNVEKASAGTRDSSEPADFATTLKQSR